MPINYGLFTIKFTIYDIESMHRKEMILLPSDAATLVNVMTQSASPVIVASDESCRLQLRAELRNVMPGYEWTVRRAAKDLDDALSRVFTATGTKSSGGNLSSRMEIERRVQGGEVIYSVKSRSAGHGRRAVWLHTQTDATLARALRGLQKHYEFKGVACRGHLVDMQQGRKPPVVYSGHSACFS